MNNSTILIIGSDGKTRNRHALELKNHGYRVECADPTKTAMQVYLAKPPALVLFAVDEHDREAWDVHRRLTRDYPLQQKGFALSGSQRLCSVYIGEAEMMKAQSADNLIAVVEGLIGTAPRAASLSEDHFDDQQDKIGAPIKPQRAAPARERRAKRLRKQHGIANGSLVVCPDCGDRFSIAHEVPCCDPSLAQRHSHWLLDQFVWDHIHENKHRGTIPLPNAEELTRWTRSNHER